MGTITTLKRRIVTSVLLVGICCTTAVGRPIYVDANAPPGGDGSSWADAYNYLQDALAEANSNPDMNEIRAAHGIYKPDQGAGIARGDREATFQLKNGVTVKGGYAGVSGPDPNARDIEGYETILSGDLDGNDVDVNDPCDLAGEPTRAENSYHVVTGSGTDATTILDGFTITGGYADGSYANGEGGGMYNESGSPMVVNCILRMNLAGGGAGMAGKNAELILRGCSFIANAATRYSGGGLSAYRGSATITDCVFRRNLAGGSGGAVYCLWCDASVDGCTVSDNQSGRRGGGILISDSKPILTGCKFSGNRAGSGGGGIYCEEISSPIISNCAITGNRARYNGGGIFSWDDSSPTVVNCTISGNAALDKGGGICYEEGGRSIVQNCIVWGNTASDGNEMAVFRGMTADVNYCDVRGGREGVYVKGDYTLNWGPGNIQSNPRFLEPGYWDSNSTPGDANDDYWVDGDYHLLPNSPCIDAGDPNYLAEPNETDLDGNPRVVDGDNDGNSVVDMGAYEHRIIHVDTDANGADDGTSWTDAFNYLQDALAAAGSGAQIWVAEGIYKPDADSSDPNGTGDRQASFQLIDGVTLKGGYAGFGQPNPNANDWNLYETILSGDLDGNDVDVNDPRDLLDHPSRAENSLHVVTGSGTDETAILDGFTISGGNKEYYPGGAGMYNVWGSPTLVRCTFRANSASDLDGNKGGGLYNQYGSPTLTDCKFIGNAAEDGGAGMWNRDGSPTLTNCLFSGNDRGALLNRGNLTVINCTFSGNNGGLSTGGEEYDVSVRNCTFIANSKDGGGGGMCTGSDSRPMVVDCVFVGNSASDDGGAMLNYGSPTLINCIFAENRAGDDGGAVKNVYNSPTLINCIFIGNRASGNAGGIQNHASRLTLTDCIFIANTASDDGGAVHNTSDSNVTLTNCIFSGNLAVSAGGGIHTRNSSAPTLTNCTFAGNSAANGSAVSCDSYEQSHPSNLRLTNCILWDGGNEIWNNDNSTITITYSDVQDTWPGQGNIEADPCFAEPGYWDPNGTPGDANDDYWVDGDYHLKSEGGRWEANSESWVLDDVTSACVDKGDWSSPIGDEPYPNGGRINMGAYGGTAEASKSPVITCWEAGECAGQQYGDATCDGHPSLADLFAIKAHFGKSAPWTDPECCADFNHDDSVNLGDLFILRANYGSGPHSPSTLNQNCPP